MKNISKLIVLLVVFFISTSVKAQNGNEISENSSFLDRVYVGGNFGLSFGDITNIQIAPIVGYRVTNDFSVGAGPRYQYTRVRFSGGNDVSSNNYGFNLFARYNIFEPFFLQAEYEYLNFELFNRDLTSFRENFNSVLIGGGISQPIGSRAFFNLTLLYNLSYDNTDTFRAYDSPLIVRAGINLGF